ncbi:MAG TPA: HEAT repeat domain-containing protein [Candidatus Limnocylindria bacterium]|nr:HEAT repeat domain-containing protein [Candidatus Limnocylindria bacterium]
MLAFVAPVQAQSLASRVAAVEDGAVTFHYAPRPGVCGDGESFIRTGLSSYHGSWSSKRAMEPCIFGPVEVRLTMEDGAVRRVETWVGPLRTRDARDLGEVSAPEAARYLMTIAERGAAPASAKAIFPAVLADSVTIWPALFPIARNSDTRSRATRRDALFWLSRFASGAVAGRPNNPFADDEEERSEDDDLKKHAVFVLSQLPRDEGIPQLLEVARSNPNQRVRSQALFWLGQSGDPRAIDLFESVLRP